MKPSDLVLLARIGKPHGIKGDVRVHTFTDEPEGFADYGALRSVDGQRFKVKRLLPHNGGLVAKFEGVNTRHEAEAVVGTELFIERHRLPAVEDEDEFYVSDLIGLTAVNVDGATIGTIKDAPDFGAGTVLDITTGNGSLMVDFTRVNVPDVDLEAGRVTVILPRELIVQNEAYSE